MPREFLSDAEALLRSDQLVPQWYTQPAEPKNFQARLTTEESISTASLATQLARITNAFEMSDFHSETQILFVRGLGLKTLLIDQAGERLLRVSQIEKLRLEARGDSVEFERLLRVAGGQAWFDYLEPLRRGLTGLDGLRQVG